MTNNSISYVVVRPVFNITEFILREYYHVKIFSNVGIGVGAIINSNRPVLLTSNFNFSNYETVQYLPILTVILLIISALFWLLFHLCHCYSFLSKCNFKKSNKSFILTDDFANINNVNHLQSSKQNGFSIPDFKSADSIGSFDSNSTAIKMVERRQQQSRNSFSRSYTSYASTILSVTGWSRIQPSVDNLNAHIIAYCASLDYIFTSSIDNRPSCWNFSTGKSIYFMENSNYYETSQILLILNESALLGIMKQSNIHQSTLMKWDLQSGQIDKLWQPFTIDNLHCNCAIIGGQPNQFLLFNQTNYVLKIIDLTNQRSLWRYEFAKSEVIVNIIVPNDELCNFRKNFFYIVTTTQELDMCIYACYWSENTKSENIQCIYKGFPCYMTIIKDNQLLIASINGEISVNDSFLPRQILLNNNEQIYNILSTIDGLYYLIQHQQKICIYEFQSQRQLFQLAIHHSRICAASIIKIPGQNKVLLAVALFNNSLQIYISDSNNPISNITMLNTPIRHLSFIKDKLVALSDKVTNYYLQIIS